ncbi:MAG: hypothetical protein EOM50_01250 [Erysipelotrichia bacterium]|nr:hypothetical protein [Erysipelotrichia bacterium]NCC54753.1 hypothetical protein [Erysipelotrichia bacterium]
MDYEDLEMREIYQESLHPKGYSEDSKYGKYQKQNGKEKDTLKRNPFKQDVHKNVERYSQRVRNNTQYVSTKDTTVRIMTLIGIFALIFVFVILPLLMDNMK